MEFHACHQGASHKRMGKVCQDYAFSRFYTKKFYAVAIVSDGHGSNDYFQPTVIWTDVLKNFGFNSIVYLAAITGIDLSLYEAATMDGASRFQKIRYITLPGIRMIVILMTVLALGNVLNAGFDQIQNLMSPQVYETGDIVDTFIYRIGLIDAQYGTATAMGLLKSVVSFVFISTAYFIADKFFDYQIF